MATRKEISEDIRKHFGCSVINTREACEYLGMCFNKAKVFLKDVPAYDTGGERKFMAIDIAKKLETCER